MARNRRVLTRKEEGVFTYPLNNGTERFSVRMEYRGKDWRKSGFPTITKARQWRDSRKGRAMEGRLFPEQEEALRAQQQTTFPLFQDYASTWLANCQARQLKYSTLLRYEGILRKWLLPNLGLLTLDAIIRNHMRELVTKMCQEGSNPKTIHKVIRVVSAIFSQANEDELVNHNPAQNPSKLIKIRHKKEIEVFTKEEEALILTFVKNALPLYYPLIVLLFRTGLREGEAVALRPEDLNLHSRYLTVRRNFTAGRMADSPKGGRTRKVDLSKDLVEVLKEHMEVQEVEAAMQGIPRPEWLFPSPQGEIIRSNNFRDRVWGPLLHRIGLEYRCVHTCRHTYATRMIMADANLVYVQKQLGHSSIQITVDLYTHWIEEVERGKTLEVDRLMTPSRKDEVGTLPGTPQRGNI